jgi:hypothetical protein
MALHTAVICLFLSVGVLATRPLCWPTWVLLDRGHRGRRFARWLLPAAFFAPPLLGWIVRRGELLGSYTSSFGLAMYALASFAGSAALILLLAHRIAVLESDRNAARELALHDPLTGLANRRCFDAFLQEAFMLARRHHRRAFSAGARCGTVSRATTTPLGIPLEMSSLQRWRAISKRWGARVISWQRIGGEEFAIVAA